MTSPCPFTFKPIITRIDIPSEQLGKGAEARERCMVSILISQATLQCLSDSPIQPSPRPTATIAYAYPTPEPATMTADQTHEHVPAFIATNRALASTCTTSSDVPPSESTSSEPPMPHTPASISGGMKETRKRDPPVAIEATTRNRRTVKRQRNGDGDGNTTEARSSRTRTTRDKTVPKPTTPRVRKKGKDMKWDVSVISQEGLQVMTATVRLGFATAETIA